MNYSKYERLKLIYEVKGHCRRIHNKYTECTCSTCPLGGNQDKEIDGECTSFNIYEKVKIELLKYNAITMLKEVLQ